MSKEIFKILGSNAKELRTIVKEEIRFPLKDDVAEEIYTLMDTLRYHGGPWKRKSVAVSSIQAGIKKRFFIWSDQKLATDKNPYRKLRVVINPRIIDFSSEVFEMPEGCLSIPEYVCYVNRYKHVLIEYQNFEGKRLREEWSDFAAAIFQHEFDHLNGILMTDKAHRVEENELWREYKNKNDNCDLENDPCSYKQTI